MAVASCCGLYPTLSSFHLSDFFISSVILSSQCRQAGVITLCYKDLFHTSCCSCIEATLLRNVFFGNLFSFFCQAMIVC